MTWAEWLTLSGYTIPLWVAAYLSVAFDCDWFPLPATPEPLPPPGSPNG